jgi:hypothetical protein
MTPNLPTTVWKGQQCHPRIDEDGVIQYQRVSDGKWFAPTMLHKYGKLWGHYMENVSTKRLLAAISARIGKPILELIEVVKGDSSVSGVWLHRLVAIDFARWLSPEFAVWMLEKIEELLTTGQTSLHMMTNTQLLASAQAQHNIVLQNHEQRLEFTEQVIMDDHEAINRVDKRLTTIEDIINSTTGSRPLGAGTQTARDLEFRSRCDRRIKWFCYQRKRNYETTWLKMYSALDTQEHINLYKRFKFEKNVRAVREGRLPRWESMMDLIVRLGLVDKLWKIIDRKCPNQIGPFEDDEVKKPAEVMTECVGSP